MYGNQFVRGDVCPQNYSVDTEDKEILYCGPKEAATCFYNLQLVSLD